MVNSRANMSVRQKINRIRYNGGVFAVIVSGSPIKTYKFCCLSYNLRSKVRGIAMMWE